MSLIALGVSGGIGAYKAVEVARGLQKHGHDVTAVMTRSARRFVGPVTLEAITRREVITDQGIGHFPASTFNRGRPFAASFLHAAPIRLGADPGSSASNP